MNYYLTQAITGHDCFKEYLCRFKKKNNSLCKYCEDEEDDANRTLFVCRKFDEKRGRLSRIIGVTLTADNMISEMLTVEGNWRAISRCVEETMSVKEKDLQ